MLKEPTDKF
jgi:hypothetical protein